MKRVSLGWKQSGVVAVGWAWLALCALPAAELSQPAALNSFTNLAARFPAAFWQAGDAYFKSLGHSGHSMELKSFTNDNKAAVLSVKPNPRQEWVGTLKLSDESEPDDYWVLSFVHRDGKWRTLTGTKFYGKTRLNLYAQQFGAPSMRPFVEQQMEKLPKE